MRLEFADWLQRGLVAGRPGRRMAWIDAVENASAFSTRSHGRARSRASFAPNRMSTPPVVNSIARVTRG